MKPLSAASMKSLFLGSCLFVSCTWAQFTLTDIFARYPELSQLQALIINSTTLSARFLDPAASNFTLLAPNNAALSTWQSTNDNQSSVDAVLLYHFLDGRWPIASIPNLSLAIPTALTSQTYTNVTGGQRVLALNTSGVEFQSDAKAVSQVVTGDIVGNNAFVHIVDKVLQIPSIFGVAAAKANLTYAIGLLGNGNYLQNTDFAWDIADRPDSTYFVPNSALALSHIPPDGNQSTYDALLEYHCISQLVYSRDLVNGTELPTFNGGKVIITVDGNGTIHANNAKVTATDYLLSNGVMHVLDDLMIPNNSTQASATSSTLNPTSKPSGTNAPAPELSNGLSSAAKAGIGMAVSAVAILFFIGFFLIARKRRNNKKSLSVVDSDNRMSMHEMNGNPFPEVREPDTTERSTEVQASLSPRPDTTGSSTLPVESASVESLISNSVAQLPMYPRQQVEEEQEPKSLNQVLEAGGLEPKSLSVPLDRPSRPQEMPQRPP